MRSTGSIVFGSILMIVGLLFLLDNLGYVDTETMFENYWPLILVAIGASMVLRRPSRPAAPPAPGVQQEERGDTHYRNASEAGSDSLFRSAVFGDLSLKVTSKNFIGGSCSVVFGGIELDLTQAEAKEGENVLRLHDVFGKIELSLPPGLEFAVSASLLAGEIKIRDERRSGLVQTLFHKSPGYDTAGRRLFIQTSLIFGEIKIH